MDKDRADRIWELVTRYAVEGILSIGSVCAACVPALGIDGAALWLARDVNRRLLMHATNQVSGALYEAAFTLGEGPCVQAWTERVMVLAPDLASSDAGARWPMFVPAAVSAGAGAIFAFPLQIGAIRVGVLGLYRQRPGPLSQSELADALALASAALTLVLRQVRADADEVADDPGTLGKPRSAEALSAGQVEVYQATGMISGQLNTGLEEAMLRLRAYAFAHEMGIGQVARLVIERRLRFGGEDDD